MSKEKKYAMGPGQFAALVANMLSDIEIVDELDRETGKAREVFVATKSAPVSFRPNSYDPTCAPVAVWRYRIFRETRVMWMDKENVAFEIMQ